MVAQQVKVKVTRTAPSKGNMTGTTLSFRSLEFPSHDLLIRSDVEYMSRHLLGMAYDDVSENSIPKSAV